MSHRYAIDSLIIRNGRCFGWGWFIDDSQPVRSCEIRVPLLSGGEQVIECIPGGMREDLRQAFPLVRHASAAGFMIHGRLKSTPMGDRNWLLVVMLLDGSERQCEVPPSVIATLACPPALERALTKWRRRLAELPQKLRARGWKAVARMALERAEVALQRTDGLRRRMRLQRLRRSPGRVALVFDHSMGGGANHYRAGLVSRLVAEFDHVLVLCPLLHSLQYQVAVHDRAGAMLWPVDTLDATLELLEAVPLLDIHVNELVSYEDPVAIMVWCRERRRTQAGHLVMYLHDYHAVCPAWTLIGTDGVFCNVPSAEACRNCLPRNTANTLGFSQDLQVDSWRAAWSGFLGSCDRIIAFSHASVAILRRAHPELATAKVHVEPHRVEAPGLRKVAPVPGPPLVVAVAGHISAPKGALMLGEMAKIIREQHLPIRIVVFGTLEHTDPDDGIVVLGPYSRRELPALLEHNRVGICLLPSVCAETFSFVTAEYMSMDMPVAVFPIGAPAERVKDYEKGLVISRIDAKVAVREIADFATRLWPRAYATKPLGY